MTATRVSIIPNLGRHNAVTGAAMNSTTRKTVIIGFALARRFHVLRRLHVKSRVSVDVAEVVMDLFNAGDVLSRHDCRLAYMIVEDNPVEMNNSVPDSGLKPGRAPIRCTNRSCDAVTNMIVVCGWVGNFVRHACYRLQ